MTAILISVLAGLYLAGLLIPQKAVIPTAQAYADWKAENPLLSLVIETLKLNEIYLAPVTIFFLALFFVNLLVVLAHRLPVVLKRMYISTSSGEERFTSAASLSPDARLIAVPAEAASIVDDIRLFLKKRFWSIVGGDGTRTFLAVKNRYSPIGFLFFHASFLLCLIGGVLIMYTRFAGAFILTEGQEFTPNLNNFRRIYRDPKIMKALPPFYLRLDRVTSRYEAEVSTDLAIDATLTYAGEAEQTHLRVNRPVKRGPLSILARDAGVSPLIVLRGGSGQEIAGAYFSLNVLKGDEDSFEFPEAPAYSFLARFYPDFTAEKLGVRSRELKDPVMKITIKKEGRTVLEGLLPLKQQMSFDGLSISFEDVRYWVEFYVVREYGAYALIGGFLLACAGLIMRLLFFQKTLTISVREGTAETVVALNGKSEFYPYSFRNELEELASALEEELGRRGDMERMVKNNSENGG